MAEIGKTELGNRLRAGKIAPVYFLFGVETHIRNIAARTIADLSIANEDLRDFNDNTVNLDESEISAALSAAEQLPVSDEKRLVTVTGLSISSIRTKNSLSEEEEDSLIRYLETPSPSTVLILVADEVDKRLRLSRELIKKTEAVNFEALDFNNAVSWVRDRLKAEKVEADERTINEIVGLVGPEAGRLSMEVSKLATAALPERMIQFEDVGRLVRHSRVLSNFDLTDYLVAGRKVEALDTMGKILNDGAEPLMLVGLLSYNFRNLYGASELMSRGVPRNEIRQRLGLRGNLDRVFSASRLGSPEKFGKALKRIAEADLAIKTSVGNPRLQIEMLVCELSRA